MAVIAQDSRPKLPTILAGVTASNWTARRPSILAKVKPLLAADADISDVVRLLDGLEGESAAPGMEGEAAPGETAELPPVDPTDELDAIDADPIAEVLDMLRGKVDDSVLAAIEQKLRPEPAVDEIPGLEKPADETDPADAAPGAGEGEGAPAFKPVPPATSDKDKDMVSKPAMDAAIAAARTAAVADGRKLARAINEAEKVVRPFVGEVVAQDSAEGVYKAALDLLGVKTAGIHPSAFRAVLEAQPLPGSRQAPAAVAMDASATAAVHTQFPNLARLIR